MEANPNSTIDKRLQTEFDNIFRDKTPEQMELLLGIFKVLSDGIQKFH
jgi:hypothetical protein